MSATASRHPEPPRDAGGLLGLIRSLDRPRQPTGDSDPEQRLLAATEQALEDLGYHGLTVVAIVTRAGVSKSSFYRYFSSIQGAVTAAVARCLDEIRKDFAAARAAEGSASSRLEASLEAGWNAWDRHGTVLRAASQHWPDIPQLKPLWAETFNRFAIAIAAEVDAERAAGNAPDGLDSAQLATLLLWSVERQAFVAALDIDPNLAGSHAAVLDLVRQFWRQAIYGHV